MLEGQETKGGRGKAVRGRRQPNTDSKWRQREKHGEEEVMIQNPLKEPCHPGKKQKSTCFYSRVHVVRHKRFCKNIWHNNTPVTQKVARVGWKESETTNTDSWLS